jgi:hypothetical protein
MALARELVARTRISRLLAVVTAELTFRARGNPVNHDG